jgi:uncharacterized surface protein with fasciclin (FAS1) repeats
LACDDELESQSKYQRPEWLAGKVFTQIQQVPELSTFTRSLELTGYDSVINTSGSYTVFAPNDEAFTLYLQSQPGYNTVDDIPREELLKLVKYHIVQNPWSKQQLMSLDIYGWIDSTDLNNDEPRGFKRETLLLREDFRFGVDDREDGEGFKIVDTLESPWHRRVATDARKYVPLFFRNYLNIYKLSSSDYEFYFNRPVEGGSEIYFAGAKIVGDEIFAENGFVYSVDRVVEPLLNAYEIISKPGGDHSYNQFRKLVNLFPEFDYNEEKTFDQPGADEGFEVDSLFDLTFPELAFDLTNEKTSAPSGAFGLPSEVSIRYHHGLLAPTDEAMAQFEDEYLKGGTRWGSFEDVPENIRRIIVNSHLSVNPVYPTDLENGFYNGELDLIKLGQERIVEKEFGSNSTFIGLSEAIVPRAFESVTGPIYLERGYSYAMNAIEKTGLLSALKRSNEDYMLFAESDVNCRADSSFLYDPILERFFAFQITGISSMRVNMTINDVRLLLLNHIGTRQPEGVARKEFIRNLAGNYIIVNNETGEVRGTSKTTDGYQSSVPSTVIPEKISLNATNGTTWDIDDWFSFATKSLYQQISTSFPEFHSLLVKAGLANEREYRYPFLSENEFYTIFAPTAQALQDAQADTLSISDLQELLQSHFIQGEMIFTDGVKASGYYETVREDEESTDFLTQYTSIYIEPGIDLIHIKAKSGTDNYLTVEESESTNLLAGRDLSEGGGTPVIPNITNTAVIHAVDKVILLNEVDRD